MKKRVEIYDWVRLWATILVILGHSAFTELHTDFGGVVYEIPSNVNWVYETRIFDFYIRLPGWIYGFHMPLFFILSGAVLALKPIAGFDDFIKNKVKRLMIPYFFYGCLFMIPIRYITGFYEKDKVFKAIRGVLYGGESGHLWFLPALFWSMIIFVIIQKITARWTDSLFILVFIALVVKLTYQYIPVDILGLKLGLSYLIWFTLGYVFENERKKLSEVKVKQLFIILVVLIVISVFCWGRISLPEFFSVTIGSLLVIVMSDICSRLFSNISEKRIWNIVIRNLFYVYIFHDPFEYLFMKLAFDYNWLTYSWGCVLYALCRTVAVFIIGVLLGELIGFMKKKMQLILN